MDFDFALYKENRIMSTESFKEFLFSENDPMGGMGGPIGADPMGGGMGASMGGDPMMGGMGAPMGGDPMMGGMGGPPMGGTGGGQQVPVAIKDADVWKVLDHILNQKPLPKQPETPPAVQDAPDPMGGGMPGAPSPMGGDPMMGGGMDDPMMGGAPPMGGPPMGGGLMS